MIPINEQMDLANTLNAASGQPGQQYAPPGGGQPGIQQSNSGGGDHCPKHGKNEHEGEHGGQSTKASPSNATPVSGHLGGEVGGTIPSGGVAPNMTPLTAIPSG